MALSDMRITKSSAPEIIHEHGEKWWFWDECYLDRQGPYATREEAVAGVNKYCVEVLGHPPEFT